MIIFLDSIRPEPYSGRRPNITLGLPVTILLMQKKYFKDLYVFYHDIFQRGGSKNEINVCSLIQKKILLEILSYTNTAYSPDKFEPEV